MKFRGLLAYLASSWAVAALAQLPPSSTVSKDSGATATQHQQSAELIHVPANTVTPTFPVDESIAHQPKPNMLKDHSHPEQSKNDEENLHFWGSHLKLDTLIAALALIFSSLAWWTSRSGSKEANRIANEALSLAKCSQAAESSSQARWESMQLMHSSIEDGQNKLEAKIHNYGKSPALIRSLSLQALLKDGSSSPITCDVIAPPTTTLRPGQSAVVEFAMPLYGALANHVHSGETILMLVADASIQDESSKYFTRGIFEFNSNKAYRFTLKELTW